MAESSRNERIIVDNGGRSPDDDEARHQAGEQHVTAPEAR